MASADGSSLIAAAIRAAILAKAPRRTVQAIAAAVTSVLVHQTADACPKTKDEDHVRSSNASNAKLPGVSAEEHVEALRAARSARRRRKRANKRGRAVAAHAAASDAAAEAPTIGIAGDVAVTSVSYGPASTSDTSPTAAQTVHAGEESMAARVQAPVLGMKPEAVQSRVEATSGGQGDNKAANSKTAAAQEAQADAASMLGPVGQRPDKRSPDGPVGLKPNEDNTRQQEFRTIREATMEADATEVQSASPLQQGVSSCAPAVTSMPQSGSMFAPTEHGKTQAGKDQMVRQRAPAEQSMPQAAEKQAQEVAATTAQSARQELASTASSAGQRSTESSTDGPVGLKLGPIQWNQFTRPEAPSWTAPARGIFSEKPPKSCDGQP